MRKASHPCHNCSIIVQVIVQLLSAPVSSLPARALWMLGVLMHYRAGFPAKAAATLLCVCVCTVLGHERRGSLPNTCSCSFTCQFQAGGSGPLKSPLPTRLLLSWEDIQADHLDVPAKTAPKWQIRKTAPVREIRRPAMMP